MSWWLMTSSWIRSLLARQSMKLLEDSRLAPLIASLSPSAHFTERWAILQAMVQRPARAQLHHPLLLYYKMALLQARPF